MIIAYKLVKGHPEIMRSAPLSAADRVKREARAHHWSILITTGK